MYSLETHVDMAAIKGGKGNPIIVSFDDIQDKLGVLSYVINQTGVSAQEAGDALRKLSQMLTAPATPETTETPNQNSDFNFLEQNAYDDVNNIFDGAQSGQIVPLDFEKKF